MPLWSPSLPALLVVSEVLLRWTSGLYRPQEIVACRYTQDAGTQNDAAFGSTGADPIFGKSVWIETAWTGYSFHEKHAIIRVIGASGLSATVNFTYSVDNFEFTKKYVAKKTDIR